MSGGPALSAAEQLHETHSADETEAIGAALAARLAPGDIVLLNGEMGTGKSTFVRGAARALEFAGPVTSPTYALAHRYEGGRAPIAHLDLHRLPQFSADDEGLLEDQLGPDVIGFIEWPQLAAGALPRAARVVVDIAHAGGDHRSITVKMAD